MVLAFPITLQNDQDKPLFLLAVRFVLESLFFWDTVGQIGTSRMDFRARKESIFLTDLVSLCQDMQ